MKAVRIRRNGSPAVLKVEDVGAPRPAPGEVLIETRFMGVNPVDAKIRQGDFAGYTAPLPAILGRDVSGVVRSVGLGRGHRRAAFPEGAELFGMLDYERGSYAEYAVGSARELAPVPKGLPLREAGALPVAGLTAYQGLFIHGKLRPGQSVLILGASGGVGHLALQFAKLKGARVIAGGRKKEAAWLRRFKPDKIVNLGKNGWEETLSGLDLVFDLTGADRGILRRVLKRRGGRIVATVGPGHMVVKANRHQLEAMGRWVASGKVKLRIAEEYPLAQARRAHERLAKGGIRGKLVLVTEAAESS